MKAHQRLIREEKQNLNRNDLFGGNPVPNIKSAELKEVSYQTAKRIIEEYEWLGTMGTTQFHYGIYFNGVCAGVVCFGYFSALNGYKNYVGEKYYKNGIQLSRGACVHWAHPHAGSKLIAFGLKQMAKKGYKYVVAFSDERAGEIGTLYQATNWLYVGVENNKRKHINIYYKHNNKLFMNNRDFCKKYGYTKMDQFLKDNPTLIGINEPNKARYIYLLGNKNENNEMMETLKSKLKPYPKRTIL